MFLDLCNEIGQSFQVVLTKCDLIKQDELSQQRRLLKQQLASYNTLYPEIINFSNKKPLKTDCILTMQKTIIELLTNHSLI